MNPVPMSVFQGCCGLSFMGSWPRSDVRHPSVSRSNAHFQPYRGPSLTRYLRRSLERDVSQTIDHEDPAEVIGTGLAQIIGTG